MKKYIGILRSLDEIKKHAYLVDINLPLNKIDIFRNSTAKLCFDKSFFEKGKIINLHKFLNYLYYDNTGTYYYSFMFNLYDIEIYDIIKNFNELADMV